MNKQILIAQGVDYYHVHHCETCGCEVYHDGFKEVCQDSFMPEFRCAECRDYVYADLLLAGYCRPIGSKLSTVILVGFGFVCGAAFMVLIHWVTR